MLLIYNVAIKLQKGNIVLEVGRVIVGMHLRKRKIIMFCQELR